MIGALVGWLVALAAALSGGHPAAKPQAFALQDYYVAARGVEASELVPVTRFSARRRPGAAVKLGDGTDYGPTFSPDRSVVAFGGVSFGEVIRVDLAHGRLLPALKVVPHCCGGDNWAETAVLAWPG